MVNIYVTLILAGRKNFSDVPALLSAQVNEALLGKVQEGKISQEKYNTLIGL